MPGAARLGRFIRESRERLGLTSRKVEEISRAHPELATISHSNLLAMEKGGHVPTYDKILTLSIIYNIPTQHFEDQLRQDMLGTVEAPNGVPYGELLLAAGAAAEEGQYSRALELYEQSRTALAAAPSGEETDRLRSEAALQIANCRARLGLLRIAREDVEALLGQPDLSGPVAVRATFLLSEIYRELRNLRLATVHARAALGMLPADDRTPIRAKLHNALGNIHDETGDLPAAIDHYRLALGIFEELRDQRAVGVVARNLGTAASRLGDRNEAARLLDEGVRVARETGDRQGMAYGLANLAGVYYARGELLRAKELARQAKRIAQRESYSDILFVSIYYLWRVATGEGQASLASAYEDRLHVLHQKLETRCVEAEEWRRFAESDRRSTP